MAVRLTSSRVFNVHLLSEVSDRERRSSHPLFWPCVVVVWRPSKMFWFVSETNLRLPLRVLPC